MIKKINNFKRLDNLDFLRGFFVVLALLQHYNYYLNHWYTEYFKEFFAAKTVYYSHVSMFGKVIPSDRITNIIAYIFIPWVSQVYLALAAFNVAKDDQQKLQEKLWSKIKLLTLLFFVFYFENFLVARDFGEAISFNPIMLWMIVLMIINIFYAKIGVRAIVILLILSLFRFLIPLEEYSNNLEEYIRQVIHPSFEYDSRFEYFFTSGLIGFLLGYLHFHLREIGNKKYLLLSFVSIIFIGLYFIYTDGYSVDPTDPYRFEHECAKTFLGSLYVWGAQILVISWAIFCEESGIKFNIKLFKWVGVNSLVVFLLHKVLFLKVIMPFSTFVYAQLGWTHGVTIYETSTYIASTLFLVWLVLKLELAKLFMPKNQE